MMSLFMSSLCTVTCDSFCSHCSSDSVCLDAWGDQDYRSDGTVGRTPTNPLQLQRTLYLLKKGMGHPTRLNESSYRMERSHCNSWVARTANETTISNVT